MQLAKPEEPAEEGVMIHERNSHKTWAEGLKEAAREANLGGLPTIIYSSRTHSQLAQVMGELRNTGYRFWVCLLDQLRSDFEGSFA